MPEDFVAARLGLQYGSVRLVRTRDEWGWIAHRLAAGVRDALPGAAEAVEHIGSTAVPGMLAKPIIEIAIGLHPDTWADQIIEPLARIGWVYRGDAGEAGGWVFVLEDAPWHRVAHAHGVVCGGEQWLRYLQFRDLLRRDGQARRTYEEAKQRLTEQHPDSRHHYTLGKGTTVNGLLAANA